MATHVKISERFYNKLIQASLWVNTQRQCGMAGQAFTGFICAKCEEKQTHSNTATPMYCDRCAAELKKDIKKLYNEGYFYEPMLDTEFLCGEEK